MYHNGWRIKRIIYCYFFIIIIHSIHELKNICIYQNQFPDTIDQYIRRSFIFPSRATILCLPYIRWTLGSSIICTISEILCSCTDGCSHSHTRVIHRCELIIGHNIILFSSSSCCTDITFVYKLLLIAMSE